MPEKPKAVCGQCMVPLRLVKNGVVLQAMNEGKPYYKTYADRWECPKCNLGVYTGFGHAPFTESHEPEYDSTGFEESFELKD